MESREHLRGIEAACRDRWLNVRTIRELGLEAEHREYLDGLLAELDSYHRAGMMPEDVRMEYEGLMIEPADDLLIDLEE